MNIKDDVEMTNKTITAWGGGSNPPLCRSTRIKLFSIFTVCLMMLASFCVISNTEKSVAEVEYPYYKYVINYTGERIDSVDVYTTKGGTAQHITDSKNAIWNFNSEGYGPFNSCYAAVDASTGQIAYHLEPNNLKRVFGASTDLTTAELSSYNIVWLIPTVYWKVSGNSLILTNDIADETGFEAYMHTTTNNSTKIWKYVGIGVYEASTETINSKTCLMSQSGKTPAANIQISTFNTYRANTPGDAIIWNFYQWTFLKMATYMVGMGKNTQQIWGNGNTSSSSKSTTGLGDTSGSYVSDTTTFSKVFVENSWGSVREWISGAVASSRALYTVRTSESSSFSSTTGMDASGISLASSGTGTKWITSTNKNAQYWDFPTSCVSTSNATDTSYPGDGVWSESDSGVTAIIVGNDYTGGTRAGINATMSILKWAMGQSSADTNRGYSTGTRMAYYFDTDAAFYNVSVSYNPNYISLSGENSLYVLGGTDLLVNGNIISYKGKSITATTNNGYKFNGYTINGVPLASTFSPTSDIAIQANVAVDLNVTVTFYGGTQNDNFVMATLQIPSGTTPMVFTPTLSDGVFDGWYTNAARTQAFNPNTTLTQNTSLYCKATEYLSFTSNPVANGQFSVNASLGMMIFDATASESAYRIVWDFGDGTSSTDKVAYHLYSDPGTYKVKLSAYNYYGNVDVKEYEVNVRDTNTVQIDNTVLYVGIFAATIVGLFAVTRIF